MRASLITLGLVLLAPSMSPAIAQQYAASPNDNGAPRFLAAVQNGELPVPVDVGSIPALGRRINLNLESVTIGDALEAIERASSLRMVYSADIVPVRRRVTLRASQLTVAAALTEVLFQTNVDVLLQEGRIVMVRGPKPFQMGSITGRVTDGKANFPIVGATVSLEGTGLMAITQDSGRYRFSNVPAGSYMLSVRRLGYEKTTRSVTVTSDQAVQLDVFLTQSTRVLDQVVVTGTMVETERKVLPTPITVVTSEEIASRGITRLDQLFRGEVAGMWATPPQTSDLLNGAGIYVRGSASLGTTPQGNRIKTYIDGVQMYDPSRVLQIDPSSIDRIEIIRGPQASTVYGESALYGVMQIFTKRAKPNERARVEAMASAGTMEGSFTRVFDDPSDPKGVVGQIDNSLSVEGASGSTSYRLGGHYNYSGPWTADLASSTLDGTAAIRFLNGPVAIDGSLRVGRTRYRSASARYLTQRALTGIYSFPGSSFFLPSHRFTQPVQTIGGTLTYQATSNWIHVVTVGLDRNDLSQVDPPYIQSGTPADSLYFLSNQKQTRVSEAYNTAFRKAMGERFTASITAGFDHWDAASDLYQGSGSSAQGSLSALTLQRVTDHNTGFFSQLQLGIADALFATAGLRAERNPNFGSNHAMDYAPRGGLSYVVGLRTMTIKARASYGRAISAPAFGQKLGVINPTSIRLANSDLLPSVQLGGDAGLEVYFGSNANVQVTRYDQTTRDLIASVTLAPVAGTTVTQFQNVGRVRNKGWEVEAGFNLPASFAVRGVYTMMDAHIVTLGPKYVAPAAFPYHVGDQLRGVPHTTGALTLSYRGSRSTADVTIEHTGEALQSNVGPQFDGLFMRLNRPAVRTDVVSPLPAYTQVHLRLSQRMTAHVTAFVQIANIANQFVPGNVLTASALGRTALAGVRVR